MEVAGQLFQLRYLWGTNAGTHWRGRMVGPRASLAHDIAWLITLGLIRCTEMSLPIYEARSRKTQYWGFSRGVAEDSMIWDMKFLDGHIDSWIWRQLHLFKMLGSDYPMMHGHVLEEQNPQQQDASSVRDKNINQCFVQSVPTLTCSIFICVVKLWFKSRLGYCGGSLWWLVKLGLL